MNRIAPARVVRIAAGALLVAGCATQTVEFPPPTPRPRTETPPDRVVARRGRPGLVVAAPLGASDAPSGEIAAEIARRTGFGLVVATGLADETFARRVGDTAQGPLRFYAEIQGNDRRDAANRIEIATVGVDREYAQRLRALCELIRDAHLRGHAGAPRLDVLIAPADPVVGAASAARRDGVLALPERALHIELPPAARREFRDVYTAIVADFVAQAVALPRGR